MKYYFVFFFFFLGLFLQAQNLVSGNIISEQGYLLPKVLVMNMRTTEQVISNDKGFFNIRANVSDELRFVKENYERGSKKIITQDFLTPISLILIQKPTEIEEVKLGFNPTGNIKKDMNFNTSRKTKQLNEDIEEYIKTHPEEKKDQKAVNSSFAPPDMYQGQVNLLSVGTDGSGGILGLVAKEILKKNKKKPNFSEIQNFHRKVKESFYNDYFIKQGLDEYEFESYIIYLDNKYRFSEKYFNNFNTFEIENKLKNLLQDYINKR